MNSTRVWALVSAYRPTSEIVSAVDSVRGQVEEVIVIDDGSGPGYENVFGELESLGVRVLRFETNRGIAAALNHAVDTAMREGATDLLTMDQDSTVPPDFVSSLLSAARSASMEGVRVGAVVPEWFAGVRQAHGRMTATFGEARDVIQSGMLISSEVVRSVGGLREDFFIDRVDTEYELRLRSRGLSVVAAPRLRIGHALGTRYRREVLGGRLPVPSWAALMTLSTPFRYYYRVRNRIVLNRLYWRKAPLRIARDTVLDVVHFADAARVARPRGAMLRVMRAGIRAGSRGCMGRMPATVSAVAADVLWAAPPVRDGGET